MPIDPLGPSEAAPLALVYHENSKLHPSTAAGLSERIAEYATDADELRRAATGFKTYPGSARVDLRAAHGGPFPVVAFDAVLKRRRSERRFRTEPLPLSILARLLECACGVTGRLCDSGRPEVVQSLRAYPSGGALYPIETYVAALRIDGLDPGIHHYHAPHRCLERVRTGDFREELERQLWLADQPLDAPAVLILAARWDAPLRKYGERGYRVLLLDAGHVSAALLYTATALGLAGCPIAGFLDDRLATTLALDPRDEPVVCCLLIGYPPADAPSQSPAGALASVSPCSSG